MNDIINDIDRFFEYLITDCKLMLSVHFDSELVYSFSEKDFSKLVKYNSHNNPYCMSVKKASHTKCICYQKQIIQNINKPYVSACHAGVCEYLFPVRNNSKTVGYVAVCGIEDRIFRFPEDISAEKCNSLIPALVALIEKFLDNCTFDFKNEFNAILHFLSEYHNNITLDDVCNYFGRSRSYISHIFKKECKMSLREYCNELKLKDAKKLVELTDKPITEIALDVGFNDVSYFINLFRKKYGMSPLRYRKKQ